MTKQSSNKTAFGKYKSVLAERLEHNCMQFIDKYYLGLEILAESPAGANRVIEQSVSAALACTSGESCKIML